MRNPLYAIFLAGVLMTTAFLAGADDFTVTSPGFEAGAAIPAKFAMKAVDGGQNISPGIVWRNAPKGTKFFAVTCIDIHPAAQKWVHWAVVNISAGTSSIPEGASMSKMPEGSLELQNSFGSKGYGGPQPPKGSGVHKYVFTVYALGSPVRADGFLSEEAFLKLISGEVLASASMTGTFSR